MPLRLSIPHRSLAAAAAALCLLSCDKQEEKTPLPPPAAPIKTTAGEPLAPALPQAPAPLKIATVDITRIFKESPKTRDVEKQQQADLARVQQENQTRLERIRALDTELETLTKTLADPAVSDMKKQATFKERSAKMEDAIAFDRERREFLQRRQQALHEQAGQRARALLEEIRLVVNDAAREEDYDYVFDRSAVSLTQTPFIISCKQSTTDLTDAIIAQLNRDFSPAAKSDAGSEAATPLDMKDR
jgi:outer membrane protein